LRRGSREAMCAACGAVVRSSGKSLVSVADAALRGELSSNPDPRPLNSRALGRKFQMTCSGDVHAQVAWAHRTVLSARRSRNFRADAEFEGINEGANQDYADFPQGTRFPSCS
jgi:hypothetical protein